MSNNPVIKIEPRDDNAYSSILENVFGQQSTAVNRDGHVQEYDEVLIKAERFERMDISDVPAKRTSKQRKLAIPFEADVVMDTIEDEDDAVEEAFTAAKEFAPAGEKMRYTPFAHSTIVPVRTRARKSQEPAKSENPTLDREEERLRIDGEQRLKRPDKNLTTYKGK